MQGLWLSLYCFVWQKTNTIMLKRQSFNKRLSLRSVADIIGTNDFTILTWVRSFGHSINDTVLSSPIEGTDNLDVIEIGEGSRQF